MVLGTLIPRSGKDFIDRPFSVLLLLAWALTVAKSLDQLSYWPLTVQRNIIFPLVAPLHV